MPSAWSVLAAIASVELFSLIALRLKYGNGCSASYQSRAKTLPAPELLEAVMSDDARGNRALSIALAAMSFRGEVMDIERLLSLADEYLQYIEGDDSAAIPRPDKLAKGKIPRP